MPRRIKRKEIDKKALERVLSKADMSSVDDLEEKTQNVLVYNVPKSWLNKLRRNGLSVSGTMKVALKEKIEAMNLD